MNTTHPYQPTSSTLGGDEQHRSWRRPTGLALLGAALGALAGSTVSTALEPSGTQWVPVITPLTALAAATAVYTAYRHRRLDWLQVRTARGLVLTAGVLMTAAVGMSRPALAVVALWSMTAITVIVTALAAGAGTTGTDESHPHPAFPWRAVR